MRYNPPTCWPQLGRAFNHGVVEPEGRRLHMTGQVAWDENGEVVGRGDVTAQTEKCFDHVETILEAVGGRLEDLVSLTVYFLDAEHIPAIQAVRSRRIAAESAPASILLKTAGLTDPALLVELVPIAVVPTERFRDPPAEMTQPRTTKPESAAGETA